MKSFEYELSNNIKMTYQSEIIMSYIIELYQLKRNPIFILLS